MNTSKEIKRTKSLKMRIIFPIIITQLIIIAFLGSVSILTMVRDKRKNLEAEMQKACTNAENVLMGNLINALNTLKKIAGDESVENYIYSYNSKEVESLFLEFPSLYEISFLSTDSKEEIKVEDGKISGDFKPYADNECFRELTGNAEAEYILGGSVLLDGRAFLRIFHKALDDFGDCIGYINCLIPFDAISGSLMTEKICDSGFLYLVDSHGTVLLCNSEENLFRIKEAEAGTSLVSFGDAAVSQGGFRKFTINRLDSYIYDNGIENTDWSILAVLPFVEFVKPVTNILRLTIPFIVVFMALGIIIVFSIASSITKRIAAIGNATFDMGQGDLTKRLSIKIRDEVGMLYEHFNQFGESLTRTIVNIKAGSLKNLEIKNNLDESTDRTLTSINRITTNAAGMRERMRGLDSDIADSTNFIKQILSNVEEMDVQVDNQSSAIEQSSASINEMAASLNNLAEVSARTKHSTEQLTVAAKVGGTKLKDTEKAFSRATSNIDSIMGLINIISDIAESTNLLSMNAAIEAAHAGNAGKGFAVVAEEIRKLANNSTKNVKDIADVLTEVVDSIKAANGNVQVTGEAFLEIDREIDQLMIAQDQNSASTAELSEGSSQILQAMVILQEVSDKIREGSKQLKTNTKKITTAMENIGEASREVSDGMEMISAGTTDITEDMKHVLMVSQELGSGAEKLNTEVNNFRTE